MDTTGSRLDKCEANLNTVKTGYLVGLLCLSVVISIVLAFFQRRKEHLWGFPGIVKMSFLTAVSDTFNCRPMGFLVSPRQKIVLLVVVMSHSLISTFRAICTPPGINFYFGIVYTTLIIPLLVVLILALQYFPLFACINASIPLLGHCMGFVYSFLWLGYVVLLLVVRFPLTICLSMPTPTMTILLSIAEFLLIIGVAILVTIWYGYKMVEGIFGCYSRRQKLQRQDFKCNGIKRETQLTTDTDPVNSYTINTASSVRLRELEGGRQAPPPRAGDVQAPAPQSVDVQARNRWLVAYTLLKNPSLVKYTAANLQAARAAAAESKEQEPSVSHNTN